MSKSQPSRLAARTRGVLDGRASFTGGCCCADCGCGGGGGGGCGDASGAVIGRCAASACCAAARPGGGTVGAAVAVPGRSAAHGAGRSTGALALSSREATGGGTAGGRPPIRPPGPAEAARPRPEVPRHVRPLGASGLAATAEPDRIARSSAGPPALPPHPTKTGVSLIVIAIVTGTPHGGGCHPRARAPGGESSGGGEWRPPPHAAKSASSVAGPCGIIPPGESGGVVGRDEPVHGGGCCCCGGGGGGGGGG